MPARSLACPAALLLAAGSCVLKREPFGEAAEHRRGIAPKMGPYLWSAAVAFTRSLCLLVTCHVPNDLEVAE